jgi:hypothetical protein
VIDLDRFAQHVARPDDPFSACVACGHTWPCEVAELVAEVRVLRARCDIQDVDA